MEELIKGRQTLLSAEEYDAASRKADEIVWKLSQIQKLKLERSKALEMEEYDRAATMSDEITWQLGIDISFFTHVHSQTHMHIYPLDGSIHM